MSEQNKKEIIKLTWDGKMKSQSFEAEYKGNFSFGANELEAYNSCLKENDLENCDFERDYDVEEVRKKMEDNNLFYNPRFSDYLEIAFIPQSLEEKEKIHHCGDEIIYDGYNYLCSVCYKKMPAIPHPPTDSNWEEEFDNKIKELKDQRPALYKESEPVEFGYSVDMDEYLFRVVDFGNIKNFIRNLIQSERKEVIGKHNAHILNEWQLQGFGDERIIFPILEKATKISLSSNKPSNE